MPDDVDRAAVQLGHVLGLDHLHLQLAFDELGGVRYARTEVSTSSRLISKPLRRPCGDSLGPSRHDTRHKVSRQR